MDEYQVKSSNKTRKPSENPVFVRCEICGTGTMAKNSWISHIAGRKHKNAIAQQKLKERNRSIASQDAAADRGVWREPMDVKEEENTDHPVQGGSVHHAPHRRVDDSGDSRGVSDPECYYDNAPVDRHHALSSVGEVNLKSLHKSRTSEHHPTKLARGQNAALTRDLYDYMPGSQCDAFASERVHTHISKSHGEGAHRAHIQPEGEPSSTLDYGRKRMREAYPSNGVSFDERASDSASPLYTGNSSYRMRASEGDPMRMPVPASRRDPQIVEMMHPELESDAMRGTPKGSRPARQGTCDADLQTTRNEDVRLQSSGVLIGALHDRHRLPTLPAGQERLSPVDERVGAPIAHQDAWLDKPATIGEWRAMERTASARGGVDALAFKVVRDCLLSPRIGVDPNDLPVANEVLGLRVPIYQSAGHCSMTRCGLPKCPLFPNGTQFVRTQEESDVLERVSNIMISALEPEFIGPNERSAMGNGDGEIATMRGQAPANYWDEFERSMEKHIAAHMSLAGESVACEWGSESATLPLAHPEMFHDNSILMDPLFVQLQPPRIQNLLRAALNHYRKQ